MKARSRWYVAVTLSGTLALSSGCDSGPIQLAELVRGIQVDCAPTTSTLEERISYWDDALRKTVTGAAAPQDWAEQSRLLPQRFPGVMVRLEVTSTAPIQLDRRAGKAQAIRVGAWREVQPREVWYFTSELGASCGVASFRAGEPLVSMTMPEDGLPPTHIGPFLGVDQIHRAPKLFVNYWPAE